MSIVKRLAVTEDGFVFDPASGDSYLLNPTAVLVLRGLQEGLDETGLIERLVARFEVDEVQAAVDVDDFQLQLRALRLW